MSDAEFITFDEVAALQENVAEAIASLIRVTTTQREVCRISLSGGGTPKRIYELLGQMSLPWEKVHWFWGDERNVPPLDSDSNFRMVKFALLDPAGIADDNIHRVPITDDQSGSPAGVASEYESTLRQHFPDQDQPAFDLVLLGLGDDAHTASLFPYTKALEPNDRWFVENWVEKFDTYRYTATADAINAGTEIWFLVAGENKRSALHSVRHGRSDPQTYPAQMIQPTRWFVTADAVEPDPSANV